MDLDPLLLARLQFAFVISFHILFPAFTIGLAIFIALLELLHLKSGDVVWARLSRFWIRIFGVSFGMGVVSGIVMSYQFGMNWSVFSARTGNVLGPLLTYEVLTAFFLEATFLGILLLGRKRVGPRVFALAAVMVALGTLASTFWILAANSWMQTPAGATLSADGVFVVEDWWAVVFSPSFPYRLAHMVTAALLTTGFAVLGIAAWLLRRGIAPTESRRMFSMTLWLLLILAPLQVFIGDLHGLNTLEHQPAKLAAMEGHFTTNHDHPMPLVLLGWPDMEAARTDPWLSLPAAGSWLLTHSPDGVVTGLDAFPRADWPNVPLVFWSFRVMVGIGVVMLLLAGAGALLRLGRRGPWGTPWFLWSAQMALPLGFIAILAGWITTEVGRQPWVVYGLMRTEEAVTPTLSMSDVGTGLLLFIAAYGIIFPAGLWFMARLVRRGPTDTVHPHPAVGAGRPGPDDIHALQSGRRKEEEDRP